MKEGRKTGPFQCDEGCGNWGTMLQPHVARCAFVRLDGARLTNTCHVKTTGPRSRSMHFGHEESQPFLLHIYFHLADVQNLLIASRYIYREKKILQINVFKCQKSTWIKSWRKGFSEIRACLANSNLIGPFKTYSSEFNSSIWYSQVLDFRLCASLIS